MLMGAVPLDLLFSFNLKKIRLIASRRNYRVEGSKTEIRVFGYFHWQPLYDNLALLAFVALCSIFFLLKEKIPLGGGGSFCLFWLVSKRAQQLAD